jgi:hypothetical protein
LIGFDQGNQLAKLLKLVELTDGSDLVTLVWLWHDGGDRLN